MKAEWTNKDSLSIESTWQKAILVIDMPTECENCPCYDQEVGTCRASDTWKTNIRNNCPLKPLPEKLVPFGYLDVGNEDSLL